MAVLRSLARGGSLGSENVFILHENCLKVLSRYATANVHITPLFVLLLYAGAFTNSST